MMRTTLDTEERNESSQLSLLPLTSTKFGIQFDSTADIWDYRDGVNKIHLNFCQLQNCSREFREQAKRVLAWYAENHSPDHLNNLFRRLQHFLRTMTKQISSVSAADLLNYRASLTESTAWYLGTLAGLMRQWRELGYTAINDDAELLLNQLRLKGNEKGVAVLTWDVHKGPFTHLETEALYDSLNNAFAYGNVSISDYVLAWLYILLGQRNKQYAVLKVCDVQVKTNADGIPTYSIFMPMAKNREPNPRAILEERPLIEQFGEILLEYSEKIRESFKSILPEPTQAPLFPAFNQKDGSPGFEFHSLPRDIGENLSKTLERLGVVSERTGQVMNISPIRFRRTIGTRAAEEGHGPLVIARLLGHSDIQNVGVYSANSPAIIERIDRAIAMDMAPLAQAFSGTLVDGLSEDSSRRIIDLRVDRSGAPMGDCGKHGYCGFNAPIACYTCSSFEAWVDGPHEAVLQYLIAQREKQLKVSDKRIASINDRTIFAVAAVIKACQEAKIKFLPSGKNEGGFND